MRYAKSREMPRMIATYQKKRAFAYAHAIFTPHRPFLWLAMAKIIINYIFLHALIADMMRHDRRD